MNAGGPRGNDENLVVAWEGQKLRLEIGHQTALTKPLKGAVPKDSQGHTVQKRDAPGFLGTSVPCQQTEQLNEGQKPQGTQSRLGEQCQDRDQRKG